MAKTLGTPWQKLGHEVPASELEGVDLYWRASNYLSVGQIYLRSNPLMRPDFVDEKTGEVRDFGRPDVKHRLVGHWGTTPGINFLMGHTNRLIADHQQNAIFLMGPGHGVLPVRRSRCLTVPIARTIPRSPMRGRPPEVLPPLLLSWRHSQPLRARDSGFHSRGWRAGLHPQPCLRRRARQPEPFGRCVVGDGEAETGPLRPAGRPTSS